MTNERAILRLEMLYENCQEEMCEGACVYCLDAIKKATEALEQGPPCGKWLDYLEEGLKWECSECGSKFTTPWNYCPNCGVKMEE